jgi:pyruvate dehydrogenase E1 component alpha subunit
MLVSTGIATQAEVDDLHADVRAAIDEAYTFARESPYPEPSALFEDMYADPFPVA